MFQCNDYLMIIQTVYWFFTKNVWNLNGCRKLKYFIQVDLKDLQDVSLPPGLELLRAKCSNNISYRTCDILLGF